MIARTVWSVSESMNNTAVPSTVDEGTSKKIAEAVAAKGAQFLEVRARAWRGVAAMHTLACWPGCVQHTCAHAPFHTRTRQPIACASAWRQQQQAGGAARLTPAACAPRACHATAGPRVRVQEACD